MVPKSQSPARDGARQQSSTSVQGTANIATAATAQAIPATQPSALAVFIARCEARALLWQANELDLREAIDELQAVAVRDGLVAELGQDEVQRLMVEAFAPVRADLRKVADSPDLVPDPLPDLPPARRVPISTLWTAEYLVREGDPEQLREWLAKHSREQRAAILEHLERRRAQRRKAAA